MFGLVGEALGHSLSPFLHSFFGEYDYSLIPLSPPEFEAFMLRRDFEGINITIPYKVRAAQLCSRLSPEARRIGSVNTVIREADGSLIGYNTDYMGLRALAERAGVSISGAGAAILGSGGTYRTALALCRELGAKSIYRVSRTGEINYRNLYELPIDVLINATPAGMYPDNFSCPVDAERLEGLRGVIDCVYNPLDTVLVQRARALGIPAEGGLYMLCAQAAAACELFRGRAVPKDKIDEAYAALMKNCRNIVLCGMPGCGKTAVGELLAARLGRPFLDTDRMVEEKAGKSIPDIFAQDGEAAFRALEAGAVAEASKHLGSVIALGGGAPLSDKNCSALLQNGKAVWLRRDIEKLSTLGRPLSSGRAALEKMLSSRSPVYSAFSALSADNNGSPGNTVEEILSHLDLIAKEASVL